VRLVVAALVAAVVVPGASAERRDQRLGGRDMAKFVKTHLRVEFIAYNPGPPWDLAAYRALITPLG
jgi:hypothetical protein